MHSKVVAAEGDVLEEILDQTFPIWGEGLERAAYGKYNRAQAATPWGAAINFSRRPSGTNSS